MSKYSGGKNEVLVYHFNREASVILVGSSRGIRIHHTFPFRKNVFQHLMGGVHLAWILGTSSLLALVGGGPTPCSSPRRLCLWNAKTLSLKREVDFEEGIRVVQMNKKRTVVACESSYHVFNSRNMEMIYLIEAGYSGAMALGPEEQCFLARQGEEETKGEVILHDLLSENMRVYGRFTAHKHAVSQLEFSLNGRLLASCSVTGTSVNVFSIPECEKLHSFHRGMRRATIQSLAFDKDNMFLAVAGTTDSVHVFKLGFGNTFSFHTEEDTKEEIYNNQIIARTIAAARHKSDGSVVEEQKHNTMTKRDHEEDKDFEIIQVEEGDEWNKEEHLHSRRYARSARNPLNWKSTQSYLGHGTCNVLRAATSSVGNFVSHVGETIGNQTSGDVCERDVTENNGDRGLARAGAGLLIGTVQQLLPQKQRAFATAHLRPPYSHTATSCTAGKGGECGNSFVKACALVAAESLSLRHIVQEGQMTQKDSAAGITAAGQEDKGSCSTQATRCFDRVLLVATAGLLHAFAVDSTTGGECVPLAVNPLLGD